MGSLSMLLGSYLVSECVVRPLIEVDNEQQYRHPSDWGSSFPANFSSTEHSEGRREVEEDGEREADESEEDESEEDESEEDWPFFRELLAEYNRLLVRANCSVR
jgi:hypothetical protein